VKGVGEEPGWDNVNPYVFCTGVVYGGGEEALSSIFKEAWLGPLLSEGSVSLCGMSGRVPMVHRADVIQGLVATLGETPPAEPYIFAVDSCTARFDKVVEAITLKVGGTDPAKLEPPVVEVVPTEEGEEGEEVKAPVSVASTPDAKVMAQLESTRETKKEKWEAFYADAAESGAPECVVGLDLVLDPAPFAELIGEDEEDQPPKWTAKAGILANMEKVGTEYLERNGLGAMRILLQGADVSYPNPKIEELGSRLSKRYKVPHVNFDYLIAAVSDNTASHHDPELYARMKKGVKPQTETLKVAEDEEDGAVESAEKVEEVDPMVVLTQGPLPSGWTAKEGSIYLSKKKGEIKLERLKSDPELLSHLLRFALSTAPARNLGFVLSIPLEAGHGEAIFRDEKPAPAEGAEGEEAPAESEAVVEAPDGKVEGILLPSQCIMVGGVDAMKNVAASPSIVQYVLDQNTAKARNQAVIKISEKEVKAEGIEGVIQQIGRPLHYGFEGDESEALGRLGPVSEEEKEEKKEEKKEDAADSASPKSPTTKTTKAAKAKAAAEAEIAQANLEILPHVTTELQEQEKVELYRNLYSILLLL